MKRYSRRKFFLVLTLFFLLAFSNCATKGLITETYPEDFYRIPQLLSHNPPIEHNPTFIVYGDTQIGWRFSEKFSKKKNWLTWKMLVFPFYEIYWLGNGIVGGINLLRSAPDYGIRELRMIRDAVYEQAKRSNVDFILNTGDLVADGRRPKHWETFLRVNKDEVPLLTEIPFLPNMGNHDKANDFGFGQLNYKAVFGYPQFYVVEFQDIALFVVNSQFIIDAYEKIDDDQQDELFKKWFVSDKNAVHSAWLEQELSSRKTSFKIVVMHHPPISFGKHFQDWRNPSNGRNLIQKRQKLLRMLQQNNVQVVFSGHEHFYEHNILHSKQFTNAKNQEMHIIVVGSGGAPLKRVNNERTVAQYQRSLLKEGLDVEMIKHDKIYNYCLVSCDSDKIRINVFEVPKDSKQDIRLADEIVIIKKTRPQ